MNSLQQFFLHTQKVTHLKPSDGIRKTQKALDEWHPVVHHYVSSLRALFSVTFPNGLRSLQDDKEPHLDGDFGDGDDSTPPDDPGGSTQAGED